MLGLIALFLGGIFFVTTHAKAQVFGLRGTVAATGTQFAVTNSDYLDVTLASDAPIGVHITSIPSTITIRISSISSETSTQLRTSTTSVSGDYIFGYAENDDSVNMLAGAGFTLQASVGGSVTEDGVQSTAGAISASFMPDGSGNFNVGMMAFKPIEE